MIRKFLNKYKGFTLAEILIAMSTLAVIVALTLSTTLSTMDISGKSSVLASKNFYGDISNIYSRIMTVDLKNDNLSIDNLEAPVLLDYLLNYMEGKLLFCNQNFETKVENIMNDIYWKNAKPDNGTDSTSCVEDPSSGLTTCTVNPALPNRGRMTFLNQCAKLNSGIELAVFFDNKCDTTVGALEYSMDEINIREVSNSCGYIAYKTKKSTNTFGVDLFIIPLGKFSVK